MYDPNNIAFAPEVIEFHNANKTKITDLSDIYAIGAILYRLLIGSPPPMDISDHIVKKRLYEKSPEQNVFHVPFFFQGYVLSNDMCYIVSKLLSATPKQRYLSLG